MYLPRHVIFCRCRRAISAPVLIRCAFCTASFDVLFCTKQAPGAASYTSKGGGSPSSLEAQLDWFDDATGAPQAGPGATASSHPSPAGLAGGAGFDMAAAVAAAAAEPEGFAQRPLATWSVEEVCEWLTDIVQLPQHAGAFKEHGIDGESRCRPMTVPLARSAALALRLVQAGSPAPRGLTSSGLQMARRVLVFGSPALLRAS